MLIGYMSIPMMDMGRGIIVPAHIHFTSGASTMTTRTASFVRFGRCIGLQREDVPCHKVHHG